MESGPYQSPSRLQRAFNRSCWVPANSIPLFQAELAIDTNIVVSDTHAVVADTHTVVTTIGKQVADMHRGVLVGREGASGENRSVSATYRPQTTDCLSLPRLKLG